MVYVIPPVTQQNAKLCFLRLSSSLQGKHRAQVSHLRTCAVILKSLILIQCSFTGYQLAWDKGAVCGPGLSTTD